MSKKERGGCLLICVVLAVFVAVSVVPNYLILCSNGNPTVLRMGIALGGNVHIQDVNRTPLMWAVEKDQPQVIGELVKAGANPNEVWPETNSTMIVSASGDGFVEVVKELLAHGANPHIRNNSGEDALDAAKHSRQYDPQKYDKIIAMLMNAR